MNPRSVGVEEELLLVEPGTGRPRAVAGTVLQEARRAAEAERAASADAAGAERAGADHRARDDADSLEFELQQQQLETNSKPCHSLTELRRELYRCRAVAAAAAAKAGAEVAALATSPVVVQPELVPSTR